MENLCHVMLSWRHIQLKRILEAEKLSVEESKVFRGDLGICLYLSQDRPDVQESVRTLSGYMGCPTVKGNGSTQTFCSIFQKYHGLWSDVVQVWPRGRVDGSSFTICHVDSESLKRSRSDSELEVYSDSNWAGCTKSTTSFMVFLCGNLIFSACRTQASVALSSCEAELFAGTAAVGDAFQMSHILRFWVNESALENNSRVTLTLHTDSSSAKAAWQRRGSGRLKHIDTRMLWLQRMLRKQYIRLQKVPTMYNPSDLNTKKLSRARRELLMSIIGIADDREVLKFMPPMSKINGSVMRTLMSLVSLTGLPVTDATSMEQVMFSPWTFMPFSKFDLWWLKLVSMVAMVCLSLSMLVLMNLGRDSPQPEEEEGVEV